MTKANNGSGNIEARDDWETPRWLFNELNDQYKFTFDCCANEQNTKCSVYSFDFLICRKEDIWTTDVSWMNPPFSKAYVMFKHFFEVIERGVAIYRCDNMETKIWQDIILKNADWIFMPKGRISYEGKDGKGARFPSALIGKGVKPRLFNLKGKTLLIYRKGDE